MTHKLAAVGAHDQVLAFRALGIEAVPVTTEDEARRAIVRLAAGGCAVIFITEEVAARVQETLARYKSAPLPAIIPIPGPTGSAGLGMRSVRKNVEKAIGADILFKEEG